MVLSHRLEDNLHGLCALLNEQQPDLIVRRFDMGDYARGAVVFYDTLVRSDLVADEVMKPLLYDAHRVLQGDGAPRENVIGVIQRRILNNSEIAVETDFAKIVERVIKGNVALFIDNESCALLLNLVGFDQRSIEEPSTETVVRGPREGFTENIHTNLSLIRRRIASPMLRFDAMKLGRWTQTDVVICYVKGLASTKLVEDVRRRLESIDIDAVIDSSYLEEFIEDSPWSPFPQMLNTERPDTVCGNLLEGRVAVLVNGTPFALVMPVTLWSLMLANEDYYQRWDIATFVRLLRFGLMASVLLLPSLYVATTTVHPEMLPAPMLISIAAAREAVPFSTFTEVLAMELTFEALREAGVRLPRPVGQTISIVGALVIGQAAVQAQFVSAPVVIIVAFTGVASFVTPHLSLGIALRLVRFGMLILAGMFGLFGISIGLMFLILHLAAMHSFGLSYLAPLSPWRFEEFKDTVVRVPWWRMLRRPRLPGKAPSWRQRVPQQPYRPDEPGTQGAEGARGKQHM